jgi:hypothetical protein
MNVWHGHTTFGTAAVANKTPRPFPEQPKGKRRHRNVTSAESQNRNVCDVAERFFFIIVIIKVLLLFSSLSFYRAHSDVIGRLNNRGPTSLIVFIIINSSRANEEEKV